MEYKYKQTMEKHNLIDCPSEDSNILPCECYHYVFEDINHKDNFLPKSERKPEGMNDLADETKCAWIGLSCFLNPQKAKKMWQSQVDRYPEFATQIAGTVLCKLSLSKNDGTTSEKSKKTTHFNFYEFVHTNLRDKIIGLESLL